MTDYTPCGYPHPVSFWVTCTQPEAHNFEHVSFDYPMHGQWSTR